MQQNLENAKKLGRQSNYLHKNIKIINSARGKSRIRFERMSGPRKDCLYQTDGPQVKKKWEPRQSNHQ